MSASIDTHEPGEVVVVDSFEGNYIDDADLEAEILGDAVSGVRIERVHSHEQLYGRIEQATGLLVWHHVRVGDELLRHLPRCQGIIRTGVGFDNIDISATRAHGVPVVNVPDYGTEEVADHTMALLLAAARRLRTTDQHVRSGGWDCSSIGDARRLRGRLLGLVGFGRIGRAVALRAKAFGLRVGFYDPYVPSGTDKVHGVTRYASLAPLLADADYVSVHAFLNDETRGLIGDEQFAQMKADAILVNTARGGVVDRAAMVRAIREGAIAQLAVDVVDGEPDIPEALLRSDRVLITPHSAFFSVEGFRELRVKSASYMRALLRGEPVHDIINGVAPAAAGPGSPHA